MSTFALIDPHNAIMRLATDREIDPTVATRPGYRWVPAATSDPPSYNPATETVDGPTWSLSDGSLVQVWNRRALTAQEISDRKDAAIAGLNGGIYPVLFEAFFNINNRLRVLEGQPVLTRPQFRAQLKALI